MSMFGSVNYSQDRTSAARRDFGITPMYKLDKATGLPEVLDEGAYFEVVRGGASNGYICIRYMRPRRWRSPKKLHEIQEPSWLGEVTADDILVVALYIIEEREFALKLERDPAFRAEHEAKLAMEKVEDKQRRYEAALIEKKEKQEQILRERQLLGKYPPNTLRRAWDEK